MDLQTAISHIKQACDDARKEGGISPFVFLVGAGVSYPPVLLASDIEKDCKDIAQKYNRAAELPRLSRIDSYSYWFYQAHPQPAQRQRYLQALIRGKPI